MSDPLLAEITRDSLQPVAPPVLKLADAIRTRGDVAAVLYYGSGLWKAPTAETIHDFYVLVDRFRALDTRRWLAALGGLLPPNVYYLEITDGGETLRAKLAVLTRRQFARLTRDRALTPQIWARFAQPCRLVYARDAEARTETLNNLRAAVLTFHRHALPLVATDATPEVVWRRGLADTYAAELRPERHERTAELFAANADAFNRRTELARTVLATTPHPPPRWLPIPMLKALAFLRLLKATLTFQGGVDYALWKIARQGGVRLTATARQRRYPLLFAWPLVWQLYRRGGFR